MSGLSVGVWAAAATLALGLVGPPAASAREPGPGGQRAVVPVATYNVCKVNCQGGRFTWDRRRNAVVRNIVAADPAVVAVQEAPTLPWRGTTQWADLTALLARQGYQQTSDQDGCTQGCTRGAHLYFDPDRIRVFPVTQPSGLPVPPEQCRRYLDDPDLPRRKQGPYFSDWHKYGCEQHVGYTEYYDVSTGMESQRLLSGLQWGPVQDRNVAWAYLQDIASGGVFLALSVHMPNEKTAHAEQLRRQTAAGLATWVDQHTARVGMAGIPVILMGDLNSFQSRQPNGAQQTFYDRGFTDAFSAPKRVNPRFPTVNVTPLTRRWDGFPPKPFKYSRTASRIDYILAKNGVVPLRHEVFLQLLPDGTFDNRYRGSDHNLVRADMSLPVVLR
ncbi:MAG TPA: endonuclease/exonuclease/phosphatase family protein [Actinomycetota bacterium]|nr:endonuclease/exonuclease/phosphatase family protein [Actinomycetota bacterium]